MSELTRIESRRRARGARAGAAIPPRERGVTTRDRLRAVGVFNTHELLTRFAAPGRDVSLRYESPVVLAWSPSHETDPAAWYHHGQRVFFSGPGVLGLDGRREAFERARAWALGRYGIPADGWATDPTDRGTLVPREVREAALESIKGK